jgi:hypothetical protein
MNSLFGFSQRNYAPQSVLSAGTWYQIGIHETGIYKIDLNFLSGLGIPTANLASSSIRIFGNTGKMLPEDNSISRLDDLQENSILVEDGGDGIFNGSDFLLFYAQGTGYWLKDSINKRFSHQVNLYGREAFYFINIGSNGKRIQTASNPATANLSVTSYNERYFFEENGTNLLSSGKEWVGNEFSNLPGRSLSRSFSVDIKNLQTPSPVTIISDMLARSGAASKFDITVNNIVVQQLTMPVVSGAILDLFASQVQSANSYAGTQTIQNLVYNYIPGGGTAQGWLNWFELHGRCNLSMNNQTQLSFRDWNSVGPGNTASFSISNSNAIIQVWDVTDPLNPVKQTGNFSGGNFQFNQTAVFLKEYIAVGSVFLSPVNKGVVPVQNLHNSVPSDLMVICNENLIQEASRLANYHVLHDQLQVKLVSTSQIYNEFSGGIADPTAIRDFIKMYFDKYRNGIRPLKNVLLFGDASFDYLDRIPNNTNLVPCWESSNSTDPLLSYMTDDFFGYLDEAENINGTGSSLLDIGIGRIPAKNNTEAKNYVDKLLHYQQPQSFGVWRNQVTLVADDEDGNLHLNDAEILSGTLNNVAGSFITEKIYLDAYRQESGSGGSRYPAVNNAINNKIFDGTLVLNYSGHGGYKGLAEEAILDLNMVNGWRNENKLPLIITAACDFAPFDNPLQYSIGEDVILKPAAGAIALMTTTRVVFAYSNRIINNNYLQFAFQRNANNRYNNLGEANRLAKNYTTVTAGDIINNRKFTLLGDPALTLAFPRYFVKTTKINNRIYSSVADTITATKLIKLEGEIRDDNGNLFSSFNGKVTITVYDKKQLFSTLANDPTSVVTGFENSGNLLFKGSAAVTNGKFSCDFIAPSDMQYALGSGVISYYAHNDTTDANGSDPIMTGGISGNNISDREGPVIKPYLNDTKFISGSLTNETPVLYVLFTDSSGINTSNIGIGHEITAVIDNDTRNTIVLNNFYQAELNNFKRGSLSYQLTKLPEGNHSIRIKAWDVFNNPGEVVLDFRVGNENKLVIDRVLNYPNPFTTQTSFWFEHNQPNTDLRVGINIFTITGKLVKRIQETINTPGNRSCTISWDGRDSYGEKLAKGTYIYQLNVKNLNGQKTTKTEKIVKF